MGRRNRAGGYEQAKIVSVRLLAAEEIALDTLENAWNMDTGDIIRRALLEAATRVRARPRPTSEEGNG